MAGRVVVRTTILTLVLGLACGVAAAQTAAPIVYKSPVGGGMTALRLDSHADTLSLRVAPHAPIPSFSNAAGPIDLRSVQSSSFGPAPMASAAPEPLPLKAATTTAPRAQTIAPYAGPPYQVAGRWYVPAHEPNYDEVGIASWYGPTFHGKASASGETFNENDLTAAHPTLPIPSLVRVTNLENGKTVVVRLNDRGPFVDDRIIDLSRAAGAALDMHAKGTARVRVQYVGPAPAEGGGAVSAAPAPQLVAAKALPPVVRAPAVAVAQATGGFYVQVGSFADLSNAHKARERVAANGQASIESVSVNGDNFYRVMVGPWADRSEADAARLKLAGSIVVAR